MIKKLLDKLHRLYLKIRYGECYYINGPDTLPPPLSSAEEAQMLERLSRNDVAARDRLITHNLRLVVYIARKFETHCAGVEDLISIGTIGLIKAVNTYKIDKNIKLATYASRCIENEILMFLRKTSSRKTEISIDEPLNIDWDGNELLLSDVLGSDANEVGSKIESEDERKMVLRLVDSLPERERIILKMRFGFSSANEFTQKEVADKLGISQSYISRLEKRIIVKLREQIENSG